MTGKSLEANEDVGNAIHACRESWVGLTGFAFVFAVCTIRYLDDQHFILNPERVDGGGAKSTVNIFIDETDFDITSKFPLVEQRRYELATGQNVFSLRRLFREGFIEIGIECVGNLFEC